MGIASSDTAAVFVIRAWREAPDGRLRARLIYSLNLRQPQPTVAAAADVETVCEQVRSWWESVKDG